MNKFFNGIWAGVCAAAILSGCGTPDVPRQKIGLGTPDGVVEYRKLNVTDVYLNLVSQPVLEAGGKGELVFAMHNGGYKSITIREWFRNEPENLKIWIQPFLPGMNAPDPEGWFEVAEPVKRPIIHYPLILMPGNQALITKKLDFIRLLRVADGKERRYFIQAETTLKSLNVKSEITVLRVLPPQKEKNTKVKK